MKSYWLNENDSPISNSELLAQGIHYARIAEQKFPSLDILCRKFGYAYNDIVSLNPDTDNLERILKSFQAEHSHTENEVRLVLNGTGIFDIRSRADRWMRIEVYKGDLITVPAKRNHAFRLTDDKTIRCARFYNNKAGWNAVYR